MVVLHIGQSNKIIQTDIIILRELGCQFQRKRPLLPFVFGIEGLVTHQILCNVVLLQIMVFPEIADS